MELLEKIYATIMGGTEGTGALTEKDFYTPEETSLQGDVSIWETSRGRNPEIPEETNVDPNKSGGNKSLDSIKSLGPKTGAGIGAGLGPKRTLTEVFDEPFVSPPGSNYDFNIKIKNSNTILFGIYQFGPHLGNLIGRMVSSNYIYGVITWTNTGEIFSFAAGFSNKMSLIVECEVHIKISQTVMHSLSMYTLRKSAGLGECAKNCETCDTSGRYTVCRKCLNKGDYLTYDGICVDCFHIAKTDPIQTLCESVTFGIQITDNNRYKDQLTTKGKNYFAEKHFSFLVHVKGSSSSLSEKFRQAVREYYDRIVKQSGICFELRISLELKEGETKIRPLLSGEFWWKIEYSAK
jgi:hypothetical protein